MVSARTSQSLQVVIGRNLRRIREEYQEASQDEGAERLRSFGLGWNRSQLAKAERGERPFTIDQLVLIAAAYDVTLADLVEVRQGERVALGEWVSADGAYLLAELKGDERELSRTRHRNALLARQREKGNALAQHTLRRYGLRTPTDAERRLAESVGEDLATIDKYSLTLWGRPFQVERDARVEHEREINADASLSALRGHATRALIAELRTVVDARPKRRRK